MTHSAVNHIAEWSHTQPVHIPPRREIHIPSLKCKSVHILFTYVFAINIITMGTTFSKFIYSRHTVENHNRYHECFANKLKKQQGYWNCRSSIGLGLNMPKHDFSNCGLWKLPIFQELKTFNTMSMVNSYWHFKGVKCLQNDSDHLAFDMA